MQCILFYFSKTNSSRSLRLFRPFEADGKVNGGSQFDAKNRNKVGNW